MKAIYYLYFLLLPILFYKKKLFSEIFKKNNIILIILISLNIFLNLSIYYLNTGCFLYPAEKTCIIKQDWSIPKEEVKIMSTHYEWWAKAGGGPNYSHELKKEEYIKNFFWLENWIDKYFFNKVSDTLLGVIFMCLIVYLTFFSFRLKKNSKKKQNYFLVYSILFLFLLEWFLNHPSLRYGGYVLFGLPMIIFTSSIIEKFRLNKETVYKLSILFICISLIIFNGRNLIRINKEIYTYSYNPFESPFFFVEKVNSKIITQNENIKIYIPNKSCWASKTPCSYNDNIKLNNFLWMDMVSRK